jgi:hypothetical protein
MARGRWLREPMDKITISLPVALKKRLIKEQIPFSRLFRVAAIKALKDENSLQNFFVQQAEENKKLRQDVEQLKHLSKIRINYAEQLKQKLEKAGIDPNE